MGSSVVQPHQQDWLEKAAQTMAESTTPPATAAAATRSSAWSEPRHGTLLALHTQDSSSSDKLQGDDLS
jgi:hypothetical protein